MNADKQLSAATQVDLYNDSTISDTVFSRLTGKTRAESHRSLKDKEQEQTMTRVVKRVLPFPDAHPVNWAAFSFDISPGWEGYYIVKRVHQTAHFSGSEGDVVIVPIQMLHKEVKKLLQKPKTSTIALRTTTAPDQFTKYEKKVVIPTPVKSAPRRVHVPPDIIAKETKPRARTVDDFFDSDEEEEGDEIEKITTEVKQRVNVPEKVQLQGGPGEEEDEYFEGEKVIRRWFPPPPVAPETQSISLVQAVAQAPKVVIDEDILKESKALEEASKSNPRIKSYKLPVPDRTKSEELIKMKNWFTIHVIELFEDAYAKLVEEVGSSSTLNNQAQSIRDYCRHNEEIPVILADAIEEFLRVPNVKNLFEAGRLLPVKSTSSDFVGSVNFDAVNLGLYFDESSASGSIMTLDDSFFEKRERFAHKMDPTRELGMPMTITYETKLEKGDISKSLATWKVSTLSRPLMLPSLIPTNQTDAFPINTSRLDRGGDSVAVKMVPSIDGLGVVVGKEVPAAYYPTYARGNVDTSLILAARILIGITKDASIAARIASVAYKIRQTASEVLYCSGTISGQIGRFVAVRDQHERCVRAKGIGTYRPRSELEYSLMLDKYWPYAKTAARLQGPLSDIVRSQTNRENPDLLGGTKPWLRIELTADSGLLLGRGQSVITRAVSKYADLDLADIILRGLNELEDPDEMVQRFEYLRLSKMKNKAEAYKVSDLQKKTRNIMVQNAGATNLGKVLFKAAFDQPLKTKTSRSILGFSPFRGGLDDMVTRVFEDGVAIYSDNFWTVGTDQHGKKWWLSCDGVKNEASVTRTDARAVGMYAMSKLGSCDSSWAKYATVLFPMTACNSIAVIGNYQLDNNWLSSGSAGTMYCNHVGTIDYVDRMIEVNPMWKVRSDASGKPFEFINQDRAEAMAARYYSIERIVSVDDFLDETREIELDVLGFSGLNGAKYGMKKILPILDTERLLKAMTFYKKDIHKEHETDKVSMAINFFRYRVFYVLGGWADMGLSAILLSRCGTLKKSLGDSSISTDLTKVLKELLKSINLQSDLDDGLLKFGGAWTIPTMLDVMRLIAHPDDVPRFVDWCFNGATMKPWSYMDINDFLYYARERSYEERPTHVMYSTPYAPVFTEEIDSYEIMSAARGWDLKDSKAYKLSKAQKEKTSSTPVLPSAQGWFTTLDKKMKRDLAESLKQEINTVIGTKIIYNLDKSGHPLMSFATMVGSRLRVPVGVVLYAVAGHEYVSPSSEEAGFVLTPESIKNFRNSRAYIGFIEEVKQLPQYQVKVFKKKKG